MKISLLKPVVGSLLFSSCFFYACRSRSPEIETPQIDNKITNVPTSKVPFENFLQVNAFEWNFASETVHEQIDESRFNVIKSFSGVRHYLEWDKIEPKEGVYNYSVSHNGGWDYDEIYRRMKLANKEVLIDIKGCPSWLMETYPNGQRDAENVPAPYGLDRKLPESYIKQAKVAFQLAARYGSNKNVSASLLSVDGSLRWPNDIQNTIKIGLGYAGFIECDNERDKWWKGANAQQTPEEYAANMSAFYDGHKGKLGKGVGVKAADPNMVVVMGGLAEPNPDFVSRMIKWCATNRGYKADGKVDLCFDIINYHLYSNNAFENKGTATVGVAPELSNLSTVAAQFMAVSKGSAYDMPVWVTETGYDIGNTPQRAIAIGSKNAQVTQADWNLRTALLYARSGIQKCIFYMLDNVDINSWTQYTSSGFINPDFSKRPAADYVLQTNQLIGKYYYSATINADPLVDVYVKDDKKMYVLTVPDQKNRTTTYSLDLGSAKQAVIHTLQIGKSLMGQSTVNTVNGKLTVNVSETPVFVEGI